ncbi:hypothetical protein MATL_G00023420 [Megalops atlanticus]|uniref:Uncharacterized protein n=1 Tax=Megalops atlanticus TaxID=7932 RepID=A0A9D3TCB1_MEGAT|nr:hypothetical protein MATL_G00023420 [Megalops atlanticus]
MHGESNGVNMCWFSMKGFLNVFFFYFFLLNLCGYVEVCFTLFVICFINRVYVVSHPGCYVCICKRQMKTFYVFKRLSQNIFVLTLSSNVQKRNVNMFGRYILVNSYRIHKDNVVTLKKIY